jgi:hypothetical protein
MYYVYNIQVIQFIINFYGWFVMKQVLIAWDLKDVEPGDNEKAKEFLLRWFRSIDSVPVVSRIGSFLYQTGVDLPNTTVWALVEDGVTEKILADVIVAGFESKGVKIGKLIVVEAGKGHVINR